MQDDVRKLDGCTVCGIRAGKQTNAPANKQESRIDFAWLLYSTDICTPDTRIILENL